MHIQLTDLTFWVIHFQIDETPPTLSYSSKKNRETHILEHIPQNAQSPQSLGIKLTIWDIHTQIAERNTLLDINPQTAANWTDLTPWINPHKEIRNSHTVINTHKQIRDLTTWDRYPQTNQRSQIVRYIPTIKSETSYARKKKNQKPIIDLRSYNIRPLKGQRACILGHPPKQVRGFKTREMTHRELSNLTAWT